MCLIFFFFPLFLFSFKTLFIWNFSENLIDYFHPFRRNDNYNHNHKHNYNNNLNHNRNPAGAVSGRNLDEAARRLVVNSLQMKADRSGYGDQTHGAPLPYHYERHNGQPYTSTYRNDRYQGTHGTNYSGPGPVQSQYARGYAQPYASPAAYNPNSQSGEYSGHGYYQTGYQQQGRHGYPLNPQHLDQATFRPVANFIQLGGYHGSYQQYGTGSTNWGGVQTPQGSNPNVGRGYNDRHHSGNRFSALGRGHRRPPNSDYQR